MASIQDLRRRASGYSGSRPWRARYRDPAGREHAKHFARKVDAKGWLDAVAAEIVRGDYVDPRGGRMTFGTWCDEYFAGAAHKRPTTLERDVCVTDHYLRPALQERRLDSITPLDVKRLVDEMAQRLAPATVRTNYGVLREIFNAAVDAELIGRTPCRGIKLPRQPRSDIRFLSPDELDRLAAETPEALVFEAPDGGPVRATNFRNRVFRPAAERAGLEGVTFHGLRHSAVGFMVAVGAHIEAIKQRMGHSSIRVTSDVYGSVLPAVDESVTEALGDLFSQRSDDAEAS